MEEYDHQLYRRPQMSGYAREEEAIANESEARYPNGGNMIYVTMQITLHIPECSRRERNLHCDVGHITTVCDSIAPMPYGEASQLSTSGSLEV